MRHLSIEEVKHASGLWFSPDNMRFFGCRVSHTYNGPNGVFFVSSEKAPHMPRLYSVRQFVQTNEPSFQLAGTVETVGEFMGYSNRASAHRAAKLAAKNTK